MGHTEDEASARDTVAWIERAIGPDLQFRSDFVISERWVVVPVESAAHFDEDDVQRISRAARRVQQETLNVVLLEKLEHVQDHLRIEPTERGLFEFNRAYGHFNCGLIAIDFSFAFICTVDDYYLVGGKQDFVREVLGTEIDDARATFLEFVEDSGWDAAQRARLVSVYERYHK